MRVGIYAQGKGVLGDVTVPLASLYAARDLIQKPTIALDYKWPLLEKNSVIQAHNKRALGRVHLVVYFGEAANQALAPPPVVVVTSGTVKKENSSGGFDKRFAVIKTGGLFPPILCIYKNESEVKKKTNIYFSSYFMLISLSLSFFLPLSSAISYV